MQESVNVSFIRMRPLMRAGASDGSSYYKILLGEVLVDKAESFIL